jgi:hypothetical protein
MIELATYVCVLEEGFIMDMDFPSANQHVSPAQIWAHLSPDLQRHLIQLFAQLATHVVLAQGTPGEEARKERADDYLSSSEQDPA